VLDKLPKLAVRYSTTTPAWHSPITITGTLVNQGGKVFCGAKVALQRSDNGTSWATVASTTTGPHGKYWLRYTPNRRCSLRVRFTPPNTYVPATTARVIVAPRPKPEAP
jgi:hypothetical protein